MQTMDSTAKTLTALASHMQLHAEDSSSHLGVLESPIQRRPSSPASTTTMPPTIDVHSDSADQPIGHGKKHLPRGSVLGNPRFPDLPPANDMPAHAHKLFDSESHYDGRRNHHSHRSHFGSTPKMDFPKFDGEHYQVWIDNCELYFEMYGVSEQMKVKFTPLNFVDNVSG